MKRLMFYLPIFIGILCLAIQPAYARKASAQPALFPVSPVVAKKGALEVYPSVSGNYLVYSQRIKKGSINEYQVVRVSKNSPQQEGRVIAPTQLYEAIRFGVAVRDGAIGYVSNRMGPIAAWMRQAHGDGHIAIANMGTFKGAFTPMHLKASADGRVWAFDITTQKIRRAKIMGDFSEDFLNMELVGQSWRMYDSDTIKYKQGYQATKTGRVNKLLPPSLFIFDRTTSQLMMIPRAFNGAVSPDGRRVVFVRENNGNYDLWMQGIDGSDLVQLTDTMYGEFEPAWSPDGKKIAFISNRDTEGDVRKTSIYVMNLSNIRVTRLTNARIATDGGPTWKDDKTILFHSNRSFKKPQADTMDDWNIWQVNFMGALR